MQLFDAVDMQRVRADILDLRAEGVQEMAQLLDMGLGGCVAYRRVPGGSHGSHDGIFGAGHTGFIEQDVGAGEAEAL